MKRLRIGVDVGGTNTDGVLLDPFRAANSASTDKGIVAWHKSPTTTNPSDGIQKAIEALFAAAPEASPDDVASVTIGTTHFVNAVVERDARRLARVAVLRLCGPFSQHAPPCVDWPEDLRQLIIGHVALLPGGLEVDGTPIGEVDEKAVQAACEEIKQKKISSVVICGIFSPIDTVVGQEEHAAAIVRQVLPKGHVVCSKDVANLGFVERENAAILNAAILPLARKTIRAFHAPIRRLGLRCPVFLTQNDGTLLTGAQAAKLLIRTFSSGPTNSMRGAAFLMGRDELQEPVMVVDIGGTTTDVGLLLANGFPRQQAAYSDLAGVRMNFSCPDIKSIGVGGGSIVRKKTDGDSGENHIAVGPDSVGYKLTEKAIVFGGDVLTTTDCAVMAKAATIGDPKLVENRLTKDELERCQAVVREKLESVIDTMKTSPADLPVLLVGGGAVIAPDTLQGASQVLKPEWASVANAIGAATARVSAVVDTVQSTRGTTTSALLEEISKEAVKRTVAAGAIPDSVKVVEMETLPLQYIDNTSRFIVRAAGDLDYSRTDMDTLDEVNAVEEEEDYYEEREPITVANPVDIDILSYHPKVVDRVWTLSETDLSWIATGCYILGTGGGGSPYPHMLRLREMLRRGDVVRVVNPDDLSDDSLVGTGGGMGSPTVGIEKLPGDEMLTAQHELALQLKASPTHMIALEIGGGNGLQGLLLGASSLMNLPVVDGDWMGRAYPTKWQTTPVVFNEQRPVWSPVAMCDGNGASVIMRRAVSDLQTERVLRAALSQMGAHVGCAEAPLTGTQTRRWVVEHTLSQAWRIGRAVALARHQHNIDHVADALVEASGGTDAASVLWRGKIVGVERTLKMGHVYGECVIEGHGIDPIQKTAITGRVKIPFKNENIAVLRLSETVSEKVSRETQDDVLAIAPDLITVVDAQNGEAIGTPEYRYGLLVFVLGIAASDRWTGTSRGIELGGPKAFGFDHLQYRPLGVYSKPKSVIDEYNVESSGR